MSHHYNPWWDGLDPQTHAMHERLRLKHEAAQLYPLSAEFRAALRLLKRLLRLRHGQR